MAAASTMRSIRNLHNLKKEKAMTVHIRTLALACALLPGMNALAAEHSCPMGNEAYAIDSRGYVVHNNYGDCVRTSAWTPELAIKECDPDLFPAQAEAEPAPAPVAAPAPAPAPTQVKKVKTLGAGALFALNKAELSDQGRAELDALAADLRQMDSVQSVLVVGHTDSSGAESYNQALSERRAGTVKAYLVSKGVDASVITTRGMGESNPVADNATAEGRAQNRRVEITIKGSEIIVQ